MQFAVERRFRQKIVTKQIHCLKCCETATRNFINLQMHTFLKTSSEKAVFFTVNGFVSIHGTIICKQKRACDLVDIIEAEKKFPPPPDVRFYRP